MQHPPGQNLLYTLSHTADDDRDHFDDAVVPVPAHGLELAQVDLVEALVVTGLPLDATRRTVPHNQLRVKPVHALRATECRDVHWAVGGEDATRVPIHGPERRRPRRRPGVALEEPVALRGVHLAEDAIVLAHRVAAAVIE